MRRRSFLRAAEAGGVSALLASCTGTGGEQTAIEAPGDATETTAITEGTTADGESRMFTVGTYGSFVDALSPSPGPWLKETFESEFDAMLEWQMLNSGMDYYTERGPRGVESGVDLYVGLDAQMFVRIDRELDEAPFSPAEGLSRIDDMKGGSNFDPQSRAVPYDTGYISPVYDETYGDGDFVAPKTSDGLLDPEYAGVLLVQNPTSSVAGQAFLFHTIDAKGEDSYLDCRASLKGSDVRVLGNWEDTYNAYSSGEVPMVVSYSADQVFAAEPGEDMARHQIRFLNDQAYVSPERMTSFADALNPDLAVEFMDFVPRPEVQAEVAICNVQFPATITVELPEDFAQYVQEPPEVVTFPHDRLQNNLSDWTDAWAREFVSK